MAIKIVFQPAEDLILLTCTGRINFKEILAANREVYRMALDRGVFRFLVDARNIEPVVESHEIYDLPEYYASMGVPRSAVLAVVTPVDRRYYEDFRFFETVCRNNGYHYVEIFDAMEAAQGWLARNTPPGSPR